MDGHENNFLSKLSTSIRIQPQNYYRQTFDSILATLYFDGVCNEALDHLSYLRNYKLLLFMFIPTTFSLIL